MDKEKVKKGLECCLTLDSTCEDCPYYSYEDIQELDCERNLRHDVLILLKELEKDQLEIAHEMISGSILMYKGKELVRCKECIHWEKGYSEECGNSDSVCFHNGWCKPDWFCADGERQEGS